jgi:hypothetical protein
MLNLCKPSRGAAMTRPTQQQKIDQYIASHALAAGRGAATAAILGVAAVSGPDVLVKTGAVLASLLCVEVAGACVSELGKVPQHNTSRAWAAGCMAGVFALVAARGGDLVDDVAVTRKDPAAQLSPQKTGLKSGFIP